MKVIKLDNRHRLFKQGFTHAFRCDGWGSKAQAIENTLSNKYGMSWSNEKCWGTYWGKKSPTGNRIYWIGLRGEALVTQTLLSL